MTGPVIAPESDAGAATRPSSLPPAQLMRWAWRQLTSMRTALVLLFLLALGAVPGSVLPQRQTNPIAVTEYRRAHPSLAPVLDRLSAFDVFTSPWFAAIYLLLFVSLVGCVGPRSLAHWRAMRARPPAAPRRLSRMPAVATWECDEAPQDVLDRAGALLRSQRFRLRESRGVADIVDAVAAEKGYLRETGNLVFHLSLLLVLVGVALGSLFGVRGSVLVVEGDSFANVPLAYDQIQRGALFRDSSLDDFSFTLTRFSATYQQSGDQQGAARTFDARVRYRVGPTGGEQTQDVRPNHPLEVGGTKVFLSGHGYAPRFTVRNGKGVVVFAGPVPFLPQDGNLTSTGVVKVPDTQQADQLGFDGIFAPTAATPDPALGPRSVFPAARAPAVFLGAWKGDLGLDTGVPTSVYRLDTQHLTRLGLWRLDPGETRTLPDGLGSITFDGLNQWATFQVAQDPGRQLVLVSALLALAGLMTSLFVRRRRIWVRARADGSGRTVIEVAGLGRTESAAVGEEVTALADELRRTGSGPTQRETVGAPAGHESEG